MILSDLFGDSEREFFYDRAQITEIGNSLVAQAIQSRIVDWLED